MVAEDLAFRERKLPSCIEKRVREREKERRVCFVCLIKIKKKIIIIKQLHALLLLILRFSLTGDIFTFQPWFGWNLE